MEELLKQLIEGQKQLFEGQKQLFEGQRQLFEGQKQIIERLDNLEGQTKENTDYIKALLHRTEELDAKFEGLLTTTATKDALQRVEAKIDTLAETQKVQGESINILAMKQLNTDAEINLLKKAK